MVQRTLQNSTKKSFFGTPQWAVLTWHRRTQVGKNPRRGESHPAGGWSAPRWPLCIPTTYQVGSMLPCTVGRDQLPLSHKQIASLWLRQPQCLTQVYRRLQACCCLQLVEHKSLEEAREPNKIYARFLNSCSIRIRFCPPSSPSAEEDFNTNMNRVYTCTVFFVSSFH